MTYVNARALALGTASFLSACGGSTQSGDTGPAASDGGAVDAWVAADAGTIDAAPRPDTGHDAGPGLAGGPGLRYVLLPQPVDLTPDGTVALLGDLASAMSDVYLYDVDTGALTLRTMAGDPGQDFPTAISADQRITALHGVPVQAGVWSMADGWRDLASPFATGCDLNEASAWDVSADGDVVVGMAWDGCAPAAMRWTLGGATTTTTLERLGARAAGAMGLPTNRASVISDDGQVIAGFAETDLVDRWPAVWHADGTGFLLPGTVPDAPGEVLSISADGSVVAGTWNLEAFTWTEAGGVVSLGRLPTSFGVDTAYANAIAADGALVFGGCGGFGATEAFVWTAAGGMRPLTEILTAQAIEVPSGYLFQNVLAASSDGTVILGTVVTASGTPQSFVLRLPVSAYGV